MITTYDPMLLLKGNMESFENFIQTCDIEAITVSKAIGREIQDALDRKELSPKQAGDINDHMNKLILDYKRRCACRLK